MANAKKDENGVNSLTGASSADGTTILRMYANPATHRLDISDGTTGTDFGFTHALRDENYVPVKLAVSSSDGKTPKDLYINSSNQLLVKST